MKTLPCPKCKNTDLDANDCGYSSFNMAWVRCKNCQLAVKVMGDSAVNEWNQWAKDPTGMLVKQIHEAASARRNSAKVTTDVSEYAIDLLAGTDKRKIV